VNTELEPLTDAENIAGWITSATYEYDGFPQIDKVILSPRFTHLGRDIFQMLEPIGGASPVERPLFEPYDVAVLFLDLDDVADKPVCLMAWPTDRPFAERPVTWWLTRRQWSQACKDGWGVDHCSRRDGAGGPMKQDPFHSLRRGDIVHFDSRRTGKRIGVVVRLENNVAIIDREPPK
jgi:hypothetical protein